MKMIVWQMPLAILGRTMSKFKQIIENNSDILKKIETRAKKVS